MDYHVIDGERIAFQDLTTRCQQNFHVSRGRHDDLFLHNVIRQEGWCLRAYFVFKDNLLCSRVQARAQQGMQGFNILCPLLASRAHPVALALEGIAGKGNTLACVRLVQTMPIHRRTVNVKVSQRAEHLFPVIVSLAQRWECDGTVFRSIQVALNNANQRRSGTNLDKVIVACIDQGLNAVRELHALALVFTPIVGIDLYIFVRQIARQSGDICNFRSMVGNRPGDLLEFIQHRVDDGGVGGLGDVEAA